MTLSQDIVQRLSTIRFDQLDSDAIHWAKVSILDTIGVALAGSRDEGVAILERVLRQGGEAAGACLLLGTGRRASVFDAALVNGTAAHALDFDASDNVFGGHPSVHLLGALFALADQLDCDGKSFISAYVAGFETQSRIGRGCQPQHFYKGWFTPSTIGVFGATAAASRLLDLSADETTHALGAAAMLASGMLVNAGTMTKPLAAGHCARNGVLAALLAKEGFTSSPRALEDSRGFLTLFNGKEGFDTAIMLEDWGKPYLVAETAVGLKQHPCCGVLQSSVDVSAELASAHHIHPDDISQIDVQLVTKRLHHVDRPDPQTDADARFSVQYCVARTFVGGRLRLQDFEREALFDPAVRSLMPRVTAGEHKDTKPDAKLSDQGGVEICATLRDGRNLSGRREQPVGRVPGEPLSREALHSKFLDCARQALPEAAGESALGLLDSLERLDRFRRLSDALSGLPR